MAENQIEKDNVVAAQTYLENKGLRPLSDDYKEETLQKKFAATRASLQEELDEYDEYRHELDKISEEQKTQDAEERAYTDDELSREYIYLNRSRQPVQKEMETVQRYSGYLHEYGNEFAQLYRIKDNNEKYGNPEKIDFIEVDITDNGDMLTQDQYFKMRADRNERVKQLALHVADEEAEVEFNIGMMEYNQPNTPPQVKMQLSFDEETQDNLDADKLNAIFSFCEAHGISITDMEIRNFDGTLAESAIREKINQVLTQRQAERAEQIAEANAKEYAAQQQRKKELESELQNIRVTNDGHVPEGVSLDNVSYDLPDTETMTAVQMPLYDEIGETVTARAENVERGSAKVQRLAKGIATAAIPGEDVPDNLEEYQLEETSDNTNEYQAEKNSGNSNEHQAEEISDNTSEFRAENVPVLDNSVRSVSVPSNQPRLPGNTAAPAISPYKKTIQKFDKFVQEGLGKKKNLSYWKTSTGLLGGWTEYIIYDTEDKDNREKDGREGKDGTVKYTYAAKIFIDVDDQGVLHFAYRTPNHKRIDETILNGIVGQLDSLGYTAVIFPSGMPKDDEKGMWRKAMGEKGIVPIGMSLDSKKAEGMLKAAKEKLTAEAYADYQYRLAVQMNKHNRANGKTVTASEQAFIDGLINGHRYAAFTTAHNEVLKSHMKTLLRKPNEQTGTSDKIAVYRTLYKLFNVYKTALDNGGNILNAQGLTPEEKRELNRYRNIPVHKLNNQQMKEIYDILYERQKVETYEHIKNLLFKVHYGNNRGARAADHIHTNAEYSRAQKDCEDGINQDLSALGITEEIKVVKATIPQYGELERFYTVDKPEYERLHPELVNKPATPPTNTGGRTQRNAAMIRTTSPQQPNRQPTQEAGAAAPMDKTVTRNMVQNKGQGYN